MMRGQFSQASGLAGAMADRWYMPVENAMVEFAIVSPARAAMFLASVGHESGSFQYTREIWGPTAVQRGYEGRKDLGNVQAGDGRRFMGRGLIQITGRANYIAVSAGLGVDFVQTPVLLEHDVNAARSAAWWWANNDCNDLADAGDFLALSRRINLGNAKSTRMPNGMADRQKRYDRARLFL